MPSRLPAMTSKADARPAIRCGGTSRPDAQLLHPAPDGRAVLAQLARDVGDVAVVAAQQILDLRRGRRRAARSGARRGAARRATARATARADRAARWHVPPGQHGRGGRRSSPARARSAASRTAPARGRRAARRRLRRRAAQEVRRPARPDPRCGRAGAAGAAAPRPGAPMMSSRSPVGVLPGLAMVRLVAAMMRTSILRGRVEPSGVSSRSCRKRSSLICASCVISPISSRNSVPPSASSIRPGLGLVGGRVRALRGSRTARSRPARAGWRRS